MIFKTNKEKLIFYNIPVIIFSLIPFFLITGPFLSDLSISLISLIYLTYCIKKNNFENFKNRYFYFFLLFCLYLIINSLINNPNFDSLKISVFYFRYGVFVVAIFFLLKVDSKFIKYFFCCIFFCFTALIIDGFYQYFNKTNILGWSSAHPFRVSSFFHRELILGSYLSRIWPIFFGISLLILKKKNKLYYLLIIIFILSEVLIFLSGDRTAFFYVNFSAIIIILLSRQLFILRFTTLSISIFLIIIISLFNPSAKNRVIDQTIKEMGLFNNKSKTIIFTQNHDAHYISAYKMFLDNKWLGVGVKNFRHICKDKSYYVEKASCSSHPHNSYIQILSEIGMIGFLFLFSVLIYFLRFIIKHLTLKFSNKYYFDDFEICILSGIAIYLWPFIPTGNVFNNWLSIILALNIPFLIWSRYLKNLQMKVV